MKNPAKNTLNNLSFILTLIMVLLLFGVFITFFKIKDAKAATFDCSAQSSVPQSECEALVDFYHSANEMYWYNRDGWLTDPNVCNWYGVGCADGVVTSLGFGANNLRGTLSSEIGNLIHLEQFVLLNNPFLSGPLPINIGNLVNLTTLRIESCPFTGAIPTSLKNLTKLEELTLTGNSLSGNLLSEFATFPNLRELNLSHSKISGEIPVEFGNFPSLLSLDLHEADLSGNIPAELGNSTSITILDISFNAFDGNIPGNLGNLSNLIKLDLTGNQLAGEIPSELSSLSVLHSLYLSDNSLSGNLPASLGSLSELNSLKIDNNPDLIGPFPDEYLNLDLSLLYYDVTNICSPLFSDWGPWFGGMNSIRHSGFRCPVEPMLITPFDIIYDPTPSFQWWEPEDFEDFQIQIFHDSVAIVDEWIVDEVDCRIPINSYCTYKVESSLEPGDYSWRVRTKTFIMAGPWSSEMSFTITPTTTDCSNQNSIPQNQCEYLLNLYDSSNGDTWRDNSNWMIANDPCNFFGVTCSGNTIESLNLNRNLLDGELPQGLDDFYALEVLNIAGNNLSSLFWSEITNLTGLTLLDIGGNNYSGSVPSNLDNLSNLTHLDISQNDFVGEIPANVGNLTNLTFLNLYANNLSGNIPSEIGQLVNLELLFLQENNLVGEIPTTLSNLNKLIELKIDSNPLGGGIPSELTVLNLLEKFYIDDTGICVTLDSEIQNWLSGIPHFHSSYVACDLNSVNLISPIGSQFNFDSVFSWEEDAESIKYRIYVSNSERVFVNSWLDEYMVCIDGYCHHDIGSELDPGKYNWYIQTGSDYENGPWSEYTSFNFEDCSSQSSIPQTECEALTALYTNTNGQDWVSNGGWLVDSDPCNWSGIICEEGHVAIIGLDNNNLTGTLPPEIGNFPGLWYLTMVNNGLTGSIPAEIGNLADLEEIFIVNNLITGNLPPEIGNLSKLRTLYISGNFLSGSIPPEYGNLSSIYQIVLDRNELTGTIPPELGNLTTLVAMTLAYNQLLGAIPEELGNLPIIEGLNLDHNFFSGAIPANLTNLTLSSLTYQETSICTPQDPTFQAWLSGITSVVPSGINCPYIANLQLPSGKIFETAPVFTWDEDSGAEEYRFYLSKPVGDAINIWLTEGNVCSGGTCTYTIGSDLELGNHTWFIQTRSTIEAGPWSDGMEFRVSGPEPLSPTGRIGDVRPEYSFDEDAEADMYRLFVSHAALGTVINEWYYSGEYSCSAGSCSITAEAHLRTGNHSWRVQSGIDGTEYRYWYTWQGQDYLIFKLLNETPPDEAIVVISPTGGEITSPTPTYSWNEVERASWYKVFIGSSMTGKVYNEYHRAIDVCYGTTCQITPTEYIILGVPSAQLEPYPHNWFIMPVNVAGNGAWSDAQAFVAEEPAP